MRKETALSSAVEAWSRIARWISANAPAHAEALNPPATREEIGRAESRMGLDLPADLRQVLMVNNGSTAGHRAAAGGALQDGGDAPFPSGLVFNDVELIGSLYTGNRRASLSLQEPGSRYEYWKEGWIPAFRQREAHSGLFLDVSGGQDPAPVYTYEEESFPEPAFPSLAEYLGTVADALEGVGPFTVMGRRSPHLPTVREGLVRW